MISYNCRSLKIRKNVLNSLICLKIKKADILCLQKTHFIKNMVKCKYSEWNGNCSSKHAGFKFWFEITYYKKKDYVSEKGKTNSNWENNGS